MKASLRQTLLLSLVLALAAILTVQLLIGYLVILPRLDDQQATIDRKDLERVRSATDAVFNALQNVVYDNAVWEEMTIRMADSDAEFLEDTYNDPDFFNVLQINGVHYFGAEGDLVWGLTLDAELEPVEAPTIEKPDQRTREAVLVDAEEQYGQENPITRRGFFYVNSQPALFVSVSIMRPGQPEAFQGTATFWRFIDKRFLDSLTTVLRQPLRAEMASQPGGGISGAGIVEAEVVYDREVEVNRHQGELSLLYRDIDEDPFMALSIDAHPSAYNAALLNGSLLVQLITATLALILFYAWLNRSTINPILHLDRVVGNVIRSRDYRSRTGLAANNELGRLSQRLDEMLETIDSQQQELASHNLKLQKLSDTDQLTGLANRRFLESRLRKMAGSPVSDSQPCSVLVVDLDHFKEYNDHYGHSAGDRALQELAETMKHNTHKATDLLARWGGEEFILVLTDTDGAGAEAVAERILEAVRKRAIPHERSSAASYLTASIGIAEKPAEAPFVYEELFNRADEALYQAKAAGRNCARAA
ncbi:diguanylate cyclase domain-containing protein [Marinobacter sp.]|uniref:sensor domain-containing diguanylate cyclase n=1 Tax=Marinobacter sp. TaxID=50741 RepID=UPI00384DC1CD